MNVSDCDKKDDDDDDDDDIWDFKPLKRQKKVGAFSSSQNIQIQRQSNNSTKSFKSQFCSVITNQKKKSGQKNEIEKNSLFSSSKSVVVTSSSHLLRSNSKSSFSSTSNKKIKEKKHKTEYLSQIPPSSKSSTNESSIVHMKITTPTKRLEVKNPKFSEEEKFLTYCPICQISFGLFSQTQPPSSQNTHQQNWLNHLSSCFDKFPKKHLKECPNGMSCAVKNEEHYRNVQHQSLALLRANLLSSNSKTSSLPEDGEQKYSRTEFFKQTSDKGRQLESSPINQGTPVKKEVLSLTRQSLLQGVETEPKKIDIEDFKKLFSPNTFKTPKKNSTKSPAKSTTPKKIVAKSPLAKDSSQQTLMYDSNKKVLVLTPQRSPAKTPKPPVHTPEKQVCSSAAWERLSVRKTSLTGNNSSLLTALTKEDSLSLSSVESSPKLTRNKPHPPFVLNIDNSDLSDDILSTPMDTPLKNSQSNSLVAELKSDKSYVTALFLSSDSDDDSDFHEEKTHSKLYESTLVSESNSSDTEPAIYENSSIPSSSADTSPSVNVLNKCSNTKSEGSSTSNSLQIPSHTICSSEFNSEYSLSDYDDDELLILSCSEPTQSDNPFKKTAELKNNQSSPSLLVKPVKYTPSKLLFHNFNSPNKTNMKKGKALKKDSISSISANQMQLTSFFTRKTPNNQLALTSNVESNKTIETKSKPTILSKSPSFVEENPKPVMNLEQFKNMFKKSPKKPQTTGELRQPYLVPITQSVQVDSCHQQFSSCPFYKKIPDTPITVDAFSYGSIPGCRAYFLTHFHYDHYKGLKKQFKHPVYCSQVTANLLKLQIGISSEYLHPLPLYCPVTVEGVNVTLLDANHCPGATLVLFKTKNGQVILHTGDFRADSIMEEYTALKNVRIHQLFLDTTYCNPSYAFPSQKEVLDLSVSLTVSAMQENPKTLVVVGSYTIGKEKVFLAIAEAIQSKIGVTKEKKKILDCQENSHLNHFVSLNLNECKVHVVKMNSLNYKCLSEHLARYKKKFDQILAFKPTGWTHSDKNGSLSDIKPIIKTDSIILYGLPYSEHSSFTEMKRFVQFIQPKKIIPTVNNGTPSARKAMDDTFKSWLSEKAGGIGKYFPTSERK